MDQQNSTTSTSTPSTSQPPTEQPSQPTPQPQPQPHPPPSSAATTAPSAPTPIPPSPNPNPNPKPSTSLPPPHQSLPTPPQPRPSSTLARPWPQSHFAQFPSPNSSASSVPPPLPAASTPPPPRGGMAIGVPAHHSGPPPPQSSSFSSYGHHFGGLSRSGTVPEPVPNSNASQARPSMPGMPGIGMMSSLSSSSQMRPTGIASHHQQRPLQSSIRPPSAVNNQSPTPQNFQGHSLVRASSGGSTSSPNTSQGFSPHTQPWLSPGSQGKPPIPSPAYRQQLNSPSLQQRSHIPQQQNHPHPTVSQQQNHPVSSASQQQNHPVPSASQQQHHPMPSASHQQHHPVPPASQKQHHPVPPASPQPHHPAASQQPHHPAVSQQTHHPAASQQQHHALASQQQHHPMPLASQQQHHSLPSPSQQQHHPMPSVSQQQYMSSGQHQQPSHQGHENFGQQVQPSKVPQTTARQQQITRVQSHVNQKSSIPVVQPNTVQLGPQNKAANADMDEFCNRLLGKRKLHELVNQIDPSERLDPEVEDILMDIADEFIESITTFSCSLAKHRKSTTLEAKDILLHVEKNWNISLPGFGGDEIKGFRKPLTNDIHKERLAVIKKSIVATDTANARTSTGQATGNAKSSIVKTPANILSSQNIKMREVI